MEPTESPDEGLAAGRLYGRRWLRHAFCAARDWFGLHLGILVVTVLGPSVGYFLFAYITAGSKGIDPAADATRWLLFGFAGTLLLFSAAFLIQLAVTPAALERRQADAAHERQSVIEKDLAEARATIEKQRAESDASRLVELEVGLESRELLAVDVTEQAYREWFEAEKGRYIEGYRTKTAQDQANRSVPFGRGAFDYFDHDVRKGDQFVDEVGTYLDAMAGRWVAALRAAAINRKLAPLRLAVRNLRDVSIEGVELQVTLPDDVGAGWDDDAELDQELPEKPRMWGKKTMGAFPIGVRPMFDRTPDPGRIERVNGQLLVTWDRFDLSGLSRHPLAPVSLFVPGGHAGQALAIEWKMASLRRRGVLTGTLQALTAPAPLPPLSVLQPEE